MSPTVGLLVEEIGPIALGAAIGVALFLLAS